MRATADSREIGSLNPNIRSIIAYNIDLHSDFNLTHSNFVPSPGSAMMVLAGMSLAAVRRRRA